MTDQHTVVQMDNLTETQRDRSNSRERSGTRSPQPRRRVTRAVSEAEDDGNNDGPDVLDPSPGVDDGLLDADGRTIRNGPTIPNGDVQPNDIGHRRPSFRPPFPFPVPENNGRRTVMVDGVEMPVPDVNAYQHKKTFAQGMMDLALLTANANQLRYVLESYRRHPYFYPSVICISMSIIVQVAVGVGLILNSQYNINDESERCKANRISNLTIIGIFIVTVVNVFISAFGVADAPDGV
ncbi:ninjurin-A [Episyrphus balteatus]|uniref:ninjurin-A n=1 Tax=Episyrphus balteatus TaxID=286459 RepID=UPI002485E615|nr:ninjurin-A [Episyrphus balteatus]